ncbi:aminotransferase class I/II-fold pyridoxal phosphate-dependent enzyme [Chitinophaga vietnamensis]|uniref:aminotransferase class I/II-fold pyridoxal phosphate-dependent enzyme n=1 Tax=Chitinophaga vietnamensis TaxID=2593957 RepID=UPI00117805C5|nr:aminotransferase class I/II-fold pyridoxal phosphate-dependent enzyme [Chitinophaga vietnamensis]
MLQTAVTPGRTVMIDDRSCLFFSGFSYLGLHQHATFKALLAEGIGHYGALFPSSRAGNLRLSLYEEIEHALASLLVQQSAVVFSSGYLSGQAAAHYATTCGEILYAPGAHPAIWHHLPALPAGSREAWIQATIEKVNSQPDHTYVIASDTVSPLSGIIYSFDWLQQLQRKVLVVLDDSHGIGITGPGGKGSIHALPGASQVRYLITASLAKAYSVEGGVVAGHAADIAALKKTPFFTGSTPMMPANAYAWLHATELIKKQRQQLKQNVEHLEQLFSDIPAQHSPGLPMFILPQHDGAPPLADYLADRDVVISSFSYPKPTDPPIQRAVVSALHLHKDLATLHHFLREYYLSVK